MLVIVLVVCAVFAGDCPAVTRFSIVDPVKTLPATIDFNDIWFYNADRIKTVPDIDLDWIAVVFRSNNAGMDSLESASPGEAAIKEHAGIILSQHDELIDFYYDQNLADDACFFRTAPEMDADALPLLISRLNEHEAVSYAHPSLRIQDRTIAFFNAFTLFWKTGVTEEEKAALLNQVPATYDGKDEVYRVNVGQMPFFQVINLLAEDIRVSLVTPYLVEIHPTLRGYLTVDIAGGNLGDPIPFLLRIEFSPRVAMDPSSLSAINLRPENIQKELFDIAFDPYDDAKAVLKSPILIAGQMKFYAPGDYVIPPVEIKYHCPECSQPQDRSYETEPVSVKISSIVPAGMKKSSLLVPQDPPEVFLPVASARSAALRNLLISIFCLVLVIAGIVWCSLRGLSIRKEKERLRRERKHEVLAHQLRVLLGRPAAGEPWTYMSEVSALFRKYLASRYRVSPSPEGGSGTVFWQAAESQLPPEVGLKTKAILKDIDQAAALELMDDAAMNAICKSMIEVLNLSETRSSNE